LRASHIKPWRVSTDNEKLDGNNGLLLAPHIDHLFDQGYISFTDEGELLVSPACPIAVLEAWGLTPGMQVGRFRKEQRPYLADHRKRFKFESK
jgi:putative restriction endonuclease